MPLPVSWADPAGDTLLGGEGLCGWPVAASLPDLDEHSDAMMVRSCRGSSLLTFMPPATLISLPLLMFRMFPVALSS